MRTRFLVILALSALTVAAPGAGASSSPPAPMGIRAASLTQNARRLIWKVELTQPFSPAALARAGRSLCLLLERRRSASVSGRLCVAGPRAAGGGPRILYQKISRTGPGPAVTIAAAVTREGSRGLSAAFVPTRFGVGYRAVRWQVMSTLSSPGCAPASPGRPGCVTLFPVRPGLASLHVPRLVGCVPSGTRFVNRGPSTGRMIALTFDDGPWYDTPQFLDVLERNHVPATFFEIGEQISTYGQAGEIERRMLADGDMVGDHTWNHANVAAGGSLAVGEISRAAAAIKQATNGFAPCLFRAPYGATSPNLIATAGGLGFKTIQWDIDPRDWARPGTSAIYDNVVGNAHPGAIVLQHDGGGDRSQTLAALPHEIQTLRSRGYRFVTVTRLFGLKLIYR